jgi:O-antigen/teichoic acid export membrane protein
VSAGGADTHRGFRRQAARSGAVQLVSQAIRVALLIGSGIVFARLLEPDDFGVMAMAATMVAFVESFRDFGLPLAVAHREDLGSTELSGLFWTSVRITAATTLFMVGAAPVMSYAFAEPRLLGVVLVTAAGVAVLGMTTLHQAVLIRSMRFGTLARIDVAAQLLAVAAGIAAAALGAGYWALVINLFLLNVAKGLALWIVSPWRPAVAPARREESVTAVVRQGAHITGFELVNYFGRNTDNLAIGYAGGAGALGLYDNAWRWSLYPVLQVYGPLTAVAVSALSRVHRDPAAYRSACRLGFTPVLSLVLPVLTFLLVTAEPVILGVFGRHWAESVPVFRVLLVAAMAHCVTRLFGWLYLSQGRGQDQLRWGLVYSPVVALSVLVGVRWGVQGVAMAVAVANWALLVPGLAMCLPGSPLRVRDLLGIIARPALSCLLAALVLTTGLLPWRGDPGHVSSLVLPAAVFFLVYLLAWIAIPGGWEEARRLVRTGKDAWRGGPARAIPESP